MNWLYNGVEISESDIPDNSIGFVYKIIHIPTNKFYIGKKSLSSKRNVKIGKRELQRMKEERKDLGISGRLPIKKTVIKSSDWIDYYSSQDWIKEEVKNGNQFQFSREIIQFCTSKKALSYWEVYWQFKYDVLSNEQSLNSNIAGKFYRKDLT